MNTETLVSETIAKVGKRNFVMEMDAIGWRGDYDRTPQSFLMNYIKNNDQDFDEADEIVRNDMIVILNSYGYDLNGEEIVDIIAR